MGLIRKSLRAGLFMTSPLTASVKNVNSESKKQRRAKATMENTGRIAAALEGRTSGRQGGGVLGTRRAEQQPSSALRIVQERYARGEITREEFLQLKADLDN